MTASLGEDAVAIRRLVARGIADTILRRQLAALPTPRVKKFVFVRRLTLRVPPERLGSALRGALEGIADAVGGEAVAYSDFPALAVACAEAASSGRLSAWYWRQLEIPASAGPGAAVGALLAAFPLEAGAAVSALAIRGLLAPVWRDLNEAAATELIAALSYATALPAPDWPDEGEVPDAVFETEVARRAVDFWAPVLAALPTRSPARRAAAFLALLRWAPGLLRRLGSPAARALLKIFAEAPERREQDSSPSLVSPEPVSVIAEPPETEAPSDQCQPYGETAAQRDESPQTAYGLEKPASSQLARQEAAALVEAATEAHGEAFVTNWGGVFFLINALRRLDIQAHLDAFGEEAPNGWRLLKQIGHVFGLPEKEPLTFFLERQDCNSRVPAQLLDELVGRLKALYELEGPWPPPLRQLARLLADETHIDLELLTDKIDLDVRLAGLDLNPGWTPWLGRVVTFHYPNLPIFSGGGF